MSVEKLQADVAAIARPEGRMVGSLGHERARNFLRQRMLELRLEHYGSAVDYVLPYRWEKQDFYNLVGIVPGRDRQAKPILLGAHYDSVIDAPCADDNAAAVAITLAVAARLVDPTHPPARDVIIAFFDAEEPPHFLMPSMGSIRFVLDQMDRRGVGLALIQDLTGHDISVPLGLGMGAALPRVRDLLFMTGAESHPRLSTLVRGCLENSKLPLVATLNEHIGDMSDHHIFRTMGVPYLFFSCGRWEHYHQRSDTPEKLSYAKMARIADLLTDLTLACAERDLPTEKAEADTTAFEIEMLKRSFGVALPLLLRLIGVSKLESRADLDGLAARLIGFGL